MIAVMDSTLLSGNREASLKPVYSRVRHVWAKTLGQSILQFADVMATQFASDIRAKMDQDTMNAKARYADRKRLPLGKQALIHLVHDPE